MNAEVTAMNSINCSNVTIVATLSHLIERVVNVCNNKANFGSLLVH